MTAEQPNWSIDELTPEARRAAEEAAAAAGMSVDSWLNQLIKYVSEMELSGAEAREAAEQAIEAGIPQALAGEPASGPPSERGADTDAEQGEPPEEPEAPDRPAATVTPIGIGVDEEPATPWEPEPVEEPEAPPDPDAPHPHEPVPRPEPWEAPEAAAEPEPEPEPEERELALVPEVPPAAEGGGEADVAAEETFMGLVPMDAVEMPPGALRPDAAEVHAAIAAAQKTGSLEPLVVRHHPSRADAYQVVTGADRLEAARTLRREEVPVVVRAFTDAEAERAGLVDRIKRRRLLPIEEARGMGRVAEEAGLDAEALAALVHRPVGEVRDALDLVRLPESVLAMVERGELTMAHGRTLARAADPEAVAAEVAARKLDIYQTEQLVHTSAGRPRPAGPRAEPAPPPPDDDAVETQLLERHLSALLGLKVSITERSDVGVVAIHYASRDQLNRLISRLNSVAGT